MLMNKNKLKCYLAVGLQNFPELSVDGAVETIALI